MNTSKPKMPRAIVLLSGGIDSASCAHLLKKQGYEVKGFFVNFGQPARAEEQMAAEAVAKHLDFEFKIIKVISSQDFGAGEIVGRNAFLAFTALAHEGKNAGLFAMGLHSGTPYYDCSRTFLDRLDLMIKECSSGRNTIIAPFLTWSKNEVYEYFLTTGIPIELTYSCESGGNPTCGICNSCKDRRVISC